MKKWMHIILACFVLVGGTAFFAFHSLSQFNKAFDDISASILAVAELPPIISSNKTDKEEIPTSTPEVILASTTEFISTSTLVISPTSTTSTLGVSSTTSTSIVLKPAFVFPGKNNEIYVGCTYQFSFQASTTTYKLKTTLIDAGTIELIEPVVSGLALENKIEPNSKSLDWKVGSVWPGEYYIKVSSTMGLDLKSKNFTVKRMSKGLSDNEMEKICKESGGTF